MKQRAEIIAASEDVSKHQQNVGFEEAKQGAKGGVIGTIKGDVLVDISGKKYTLSLYIGFIQMEMSAYTM